MSILLCVGMFQGLMRLYCQKVITLPMAGGQIEGSIQKMRTKIYYVVKVWYVQLILE